MGARAKSRGHIVAPESARVVPLRTSRAILVALAAIMGVDYFVWRLSTFNPHALVLSLALYAAELFGVITIAMHAFMVWRLVERHAPEPDPDATVDIFIPTYNEPVEMLRRTLVAARGMSHVHETWLLDDGNRPAMAALAAELGVRYLARTDNAHAKAGNLNNALAHSTGDFIAIFDADHVPHESFLEKTLGYFREKNVAFVQTPQDFYNLDSFQHRRSSRRNVIWTEQSLFFRIIMPGKDYWNAAFFCGSCAIARRSALLSVGGFATETITEDLHTSLRLHKKGYGSVYHGESLAFGIAPDTFEPYESQRVRWGQGAMQVWREEGIVTARGLTWAQRICYLASVITYFDGWQKAFMYVLPAFVLATGILPVKTLDWNFVAHFIPWAILSFWATEELGRGYARSWTIEQYNFLRGPGFAFATLTFLLRRRLKFHVTRKGGSARAENIRRMAPHLSIILISFAAALFGCARFVVAPHMPLSAFFLNLLWLGVVATIATGAVLFAFKRSKQERAAYRFRLPIPMLIRWENGGTEVVATDDVSSDGLQLGLPPGTDVAVGAKLDAQLVLPAGRTPVVVEAMRVWEEPREDDTESRKLGLRFDWDSHAAADDLNRYLYGSNAEWLFGGLLERLPTPLDRIFALIRSAGASGTTRDKIWKPAVCVPSDFSCSTVALISKTRSEDDAELLCSKPFTNEKLMVIMPDSSQHVAAYRVIGIRPHQAENGLFYIHRLRKRARTDSDTIDWGEIRRPVEISAIA